MEIKDVEKLAALARIDISDEEKLSLLKDFESILGYIDSIKKADIEAVDPEYELYNAWREDIPENREFSRDLIVEQFPEQQDGFLKVKKIL
jgi:aspartyl-tRNA(Asn)/glutamyl-tRNA(Gln) amidotransferase subunit C